MPDPLTRTSVQLSARHLKSLEKEASRTGVRWGEVLRRILDGWIDGPSFQQHHDRRLTYDHPGSHPKG